MKTLKGGLLALSALMAIGAADIAAQDEAEEQVRRSGRRGVAVEAIMSMRERLELTDEQIASLDAIRRDAVAQRSADQAEMAEMRSLLQAGQIRQSEMMAFMEERRDAEPDVREQQRALIDGLLNETQREALVDMPSRGRAFAHGRASAGRDGMARGGRSFRGNARGGRSFRGAPGRGANRGQRWNRQGMLGRGQAGMGGAPWRGRTGPPAMNRRGGGDEPAPTGDTDLTGGSR